MRLYIKKEDMKKMIGNANRMKRSNDVIVAVVVVVIIVAVAVASFCLISS